MTESKYILVVDDDPDLVETVSMNLEAKGFKVGKAYDGMEGWESVQAKRPDLIVLDVMMPRKDGYQLCQDLKTSGDFQDIPIIMLTSVGSEVPTTNYTHQQGMQLLADDYMPKPVDMAKLMDLVAELA